MSRRKKSRIAKGLLIRDKAELMRKTITGVDVGGNAGKGQQEDFNLVKELAVVKSKTLAKWRK